MTKIVILSILIFSQSLFAMERIGYPIGVISCDKKVKVYKEIGKNLESLPCKEMYGFDYKSDEMGIFVYSKKAAEEDWAQVFTTNGEKRWILAVESFNRGGPFRELDFPIRQGLYKFNSKWDKKIYEDPQRGQFTEAKKKPYEVEITKGEFFDGKLWVKINIYSSGRCINEDEELPKILHSGWVPFMKTNTESNFEEPFECG